MSTPTPTPPATTGWVTAPPIAAAPHGTTVTHRGRPVGRVTQGRAVLPALDPDLRADLQLGTVTVIPGPGDTLALTSKQPGPPVKLWPAGITPPPPAPTSPR